MDCGRKWTLVVSGLWTDVNWCRTHRTSPPSGAGTAHASVQCRTHRTSPGQCRTRPRLRQCRTHRTSPPSVPDAPHLASVQCRHFSAGRTAPRPFPETAARRKPSHQSVTDYRFRTGEASACKYFPASSGYIMTAARKASARSALAGLPTTTQTSSLIDGIMISSFDPVCPWWLIALWLLLMLAMAAWTYRRLRAHVQTSIAHAELEIVLAAWPDPVDPSASNAEPVHSNCGLAVSLSMVHWTATRPKRRQS